MASIPYVTKVLMPGRLPALVPRRRLLDTLHRNLAFRLSLVCAGPGYGKTTLLADFGRESDRAVAWYSLDERDDDPRTFLSYLIASVRYRLPDFGRELESVVAEEQGGEDWLDSLAATLVNELLAAAAQLLIILDDSHRVPPNAQTWKLLDKALPRFPDNCQVILSGRTRPPLAGLPRLLSQGQGIVLGPEELRFTEEEVRQFLKLAGVEAPEFVERAGAAEGWAAGLVLSCLGGDVASARQRRAEEWVFDYLASEVLDQQPERIRAFLLETSILEQLSAAVCDALRGASDSAKLLRSICASNLFLMPLEGDDWPWYRYHTLFRDFLGARFHADQPDRWRDLHTRAALLARERGAYEEVLYHLAEVGDAQGVAEFLEQSGEQMLAAGQWSALAHWSDWLPSSRLLARPWLALLRGQAALRLGSPGTAQVSAGQVLATIEPEAHQLKAQALTLQANALRLQGSYQEALEAARAATQIPCDSPHITAEAWRRVAICLAMMGRADESIEAFERCLTLLRPGGPAHLEAEAHQDLGVALARQGDLEPAEVHYRAAENHWRAVKNRSRQAQTLNSLGMVASLRGEYKAAEGLFTEAAALAEQAGYLRFRAYALVSLGDVHRDSGLLTEAEQSYTEGAQLAERTREAFLTAYVADALGGLRRLQGDLETAERLSRRALAQAERRGSAYEQGLYETSVGIVEYEKGAPERAAARLRRAIELLGACRARPQVARAHFHLAQALFLSQSHDEALLQLDRMAHVLDELGYDGFLAAEARRAPLLLQFAASKRADGRAVARWAAELAPRAPNGSQERRRLLRPGAPLVAYALGQSRVEVDGKVVTELQWRSARSRELFFYLLVEPGWATREELMDRLGPELPPGSGVNTFHSHLHRLRRALFSACLLQERGRYRLDPDLECWFDAAEFERLVAKAERHRESAQRASAYLEALRLYKGPFLQECYADWCLPHRRRLEDRYLSALHWLARHYSGLGDHPRAAELWERALKTDAYSEEAHRGLMRAYAQAGDADSALRHYRLWDQQLQDELGARPEQATQRLYEELKRHEGTPVAARS